MITDDLEILQLYEDFMQNFDIGKALIDLIDPNPYGFVQLGVYEN